MARSTAYMSKADGLRWLHATLTVFGKRLFVTTFCAFAPGNGVRSLATDEGLVASIAQRWKFSSPPVSCMYISVFESSAQKAERMPRYVSAVTTRSSLLPSVLHQIFSTPSAFGRK